jgi:hypothetical protein
MKGISSSQQCHDRAWKDLYMAALFESDKTKLAERIATAQRAIGARQRALFTSEDDRHERQALDNALFSLQALEACLLITPRMAARARAA